MKKLLSSLVLAALIVVSFTTPIAADEISIVASLHPDSPTGEIHPAGLGENLLVFRISSTADISVNNFDIRWQGEGNVRVENVTISSNGDLLDYFSGEVYPGQTISLINDDSPVKDDSSVYLQAGINTFYVKGDVSGMGSFQTILDSIRVESGIVQNLPVTGNTLSVEFYPEIFIFSPTGEEWIIGETYEIEWGANAVRNVNIDIEDSNGVSRSIAYDCPYSGKLQWTVSNLTPGEYRIVAWENKKAGAVSYSVPFTVRERNGLSVEQLQAQIAALLAAIANLQQQLNSYVKTTLIVSAPSHVEVGEEFDVTIKISETRFVAGQYWLSFNPEIFEIVEISNGEINGRKIGGVFNEAYPGTLRAIQSSDDFTEFVGAGDLARIKFRAISASEGESITLTEVIFSDLTEIGVVPTASLGTSIEVVPSVRDGDINRDGVINVLDVVALIHIILDQ